MISDSGEIGDLVQVTDRSHKQSFEPTLSPDGQWIVFESHDEDVEANGIITKYKVDKSSQYIELTTLGDDCRQPNWSSEGEKILFQKQDQGTWAIWTMDTDGQNPIMVTANTQGATDGVFSHGGEWIFYSSENDDVAISNIYKIPVGGGNAVQITKFDGYDGAPSVCPDGDELAFESMDKDPDGTAGTTIWVKDLE